jgi:predicted O-linked N-acetylglucosamine transferase (SPINDLY family)
LRAIAEENIACIIPGSATATPADIRAARQAWGRRITEGIRPLPHPKRPASGEKRRIAYLSAFFASPNWMKPVYGVINHHDRQRFEIHLVSTGPAPTQEAGYRDHAADVIWQVAALDDAGLAKHLAAAGIDVLVDLNAYSAPTCLRLFARRPAPVQLAWFNSFATSGLDCFDGIIGDGTVIPPAEEAGYTEPVLRVPGTYLAFEVLYPVPEVAPLPCQAARGQITFGAQVSAYKLTDLTLAAWAAILRAAPNARLRIRATTLDEPSNRAHLLARLARLGIEPVRIDLAGRAPHIDFLRGYDRIDIALDTFPYNGGTTTTEALWQGVPMLTCRGDRWAARTSHSLLRAAGLEEWVAENADDFIAKAIALALDPATPDRLATLRADMRARLRASSVCDTIGLCRSLEAIYLHFNE